MTVVGQTKLTTLVTIDIQWRKAEKSAKFRVWDNVQDGNILILEIPEFQIPLKYSAG